MIDSWNAAILNKRIDGAASQISGIAESVSLGGVKNFNAYPYHNTTKTTNGITYTDNGDGTVKVTGKNTSSGRNSFICHSRSDGIAFYLPNGKYILSGCPEGGSETTWYIEAGRTVSSALKLYGREYGKGLIFEVNGDDNNTDKARIQLVLYITGHDDLPEAGIVFKPMISPYNMDGRYEPYALSNQELSKMACKKTTAGNYQLIATVDSDGVLTYSWEVIT